MTRQELQELLERWEQDAEVADGFDNCIIGVTCNDPPRVVYDHDKCIEALMSQGMDYAGATEFFEFNVLSSCGGDGPIFVHTS